LLSLSFKKFRKYFYSAVAIALTTHCIALQALPLLPRLLLPISHSCCCHPSLPFALWLILDSCLFIFPFISCIRWLIFYHTKCTNPTHFQPAVVSCTLVSFFKMYRTQHRPYNLQVGLAKELWLYDRPCCMSIYINLSKYFLDIIDRQIVGRIATLS